MGWVECVASSAVSLGKGQTLDFIKTPDTQHNTIINLSIYQFNNFQLINVLIYMFPNLPTFQFINISFFQMRQICQFWCISHQFINLAIMIKCQFIIRLDTNNLLPHLAFMREPKYQLESWNGTKPAANSVYKDSLNFYSVWWMKNIQTTKSYNLNKWNSLLKGESSGVQPSHV